MRVFIATDVSVIDNQGRIYAKNKYATIFKRYYNAFGKLVLFLRVETDGQITNDCCEITQFVEKVIPVISLKNIVLNQYNKIICDEMQKCDLVVARCPGFSGYKASDCAKKVGKPYFTEVMGCAWDAYWNHSVVGKIIAPYMYLKMKSVVGNAQYSLYVTEEFLQKRYPCKRKSIGVSNVLIQKCSEEVLEKRLKRIATMNTHKVTLVTTAAIDVRYKGQEYVIKALPKLIEKGLDVEYLLIGEGESAFLQSLAKRYGVSERVKFLGRISLEEVFKTIDDVDIYIQPSLQEGLPRSVIEAMSRACPCVGAKTAGIPELLQEECLVERKSVQSICDVIIDILDKAKLHDLAVENFERAHLFLEEELSKKRQRYYECVIEELG